MMKVSLMNMSFESKSYILYMENALYSVSPCAQVYLFIRLFLTIDANNDGHLSAAELKALIIGISFEDIDFDKDDAVGKVLQDFDKTLDEQVDQEEFVRGIKQWLIQAMGGAPSGPEAGPRTMKFLDNFHVVRKTVETLFEQTWVTKLIWNLTQLVLSFFLFCSKQRESMLCWEITRMVRMMRKAVRLQTQNGSPLKQLCCYC